VEGGSASPFSDISASHWAYADIAAAQKRCIVTGYTDNTFRPGEPVTREEFVVMLMRAFTVNCAAEQLPDVPTNYTDDAQIGAWARSSIIKADEQNVITGYADGSFRPRSNITRVEATAMLARYLQYPLVDGNTLPFADREEIGIWARAYVEAAVGREVVSGRPNNLFAPLEATTRAEAVSLIMRAIHGSEQK
jgi:hexosaminidase